jgi:hypothetical protein
MSKFLSGRVPEFKVGIVSYSENKTVLEVTGNAYALGNVGIGLTNPEYKLHIDGETRIGNQTSGSGGWFRVSLRDGTAAPAAATLTMRSSASSSEAIPTTQPNLVLNRGSDTLGTLLQFKNNRTGYAAVGSLAESNGGHDLRVYVGIGTEVIRVNSAGNVGFGTINPTSKLTIVGDASFSGVITAVGGFNLGISSAGTPITTGPITTLNFVGAGNTFAVNGTTVDISIAGGGGAAVAISTTAPEDPDEGDLWYSSLLGRTFVYYVDENSSQWVDASPFNIPEPEIELIPGKTSATFTATEGQTVFNYTYKPEFIDVFLNGIRLNSSQFIAGNGTSITLITPASLNDVLDIVEYTMGIGDTGPQGAAGPLEGIVETTSNETLYPLIVTGIGTTTPYITTTNDYFEFNPSSGTLTTNQLNIVGVITAIGGFNLGISSAGTPITTGPVTELNFIGVGNTFAINGTTVDISIAGGGGGSSVSISEEPPEDPNEGDLWYSSVLGRTFIYYIDEDSAQWVDASPFNRDADKTLTIGTRTEAKVLSLSGAGLTLLLRSGIGTATF